MAINNLPQIILSGVVSSALIVGIFTVIFSAGGHVEKIEANTRAAAKLTEQMTKVLVVMGDATEIPPNETGRMLKDIRTIAKDHEDRIRRLEKVTPAP